jgi:hypothetical protein
MEMDTCNGSANRHVTVLGYRTASGYQVLCKLKYQHQTHPDVRTAKLHASKLRRYNFISSLAILRPRQLELCPARQSQSSLESTTTTTSIASTRSRSTLEPRGTRRSSSRAHAASTHNFPEPVGLKWCVSLPFFFSDHVPILADDMSLRVRYNLSCSIRRYRRSHSNVCVGGSTPFSQLLHSHRAKTQTNYN